VISHDRIVIFRAIMW